LHLPILKQCVNELLADDGEIVSLQPVRWLQDPFNNRSKMLMDGIEFTDIETIDSIEARKAFDAGMNVDLGIYVINNKLPKVDKANFAIKDSTSFVFDKVFQHLPDTLKEHMVKYDGQANFCPVAKIMGGKSATTSKPTQCLYGNILGKRIKTGYTFDGTDGITFATPAERENFYNSCKTTFYRFLVFKGMSDVHIRHSRLPFMSDYTKSWDNQRFYEYFKITSDEAKVIDETMAPYVERNY
jgi:hypothetical protein